MRSDFDDPDHNEDENERSSDSHAEDFQTLDHGVLSVATRVLKGIASNPRLVFRELNRLYHRRFHTWQYNRRGDDIFEEDWDNLLILDACRFDVFEARSDLPGGLESRWSKGSNTIEFLKGNLSTRELYDTVYVTANPQFFRRKDEIEGRFHHVVNVWDSGWDPELGTVPPAATTEHARWAASEFPDKRLLVHYLQPHYPFIGHAINTGKLENEQNPSVWDLAMADEIDGEAIWEAYVDNLDLVLEHVRPLLTELEGKTVVTSDHGNMMGERARPFPIREWGHPVGIYTDELVRIPWYESVNGARKTVTADPPTEETTATTDEATVSDRLRDLGYRE